MAADRPADPTPRTAAGRQEAAIAMFRREGFVFDGLGGRWEKCAFTLYTYLVEAVEEAEAATPALDRDKIEHVARYLRRRYNLRQSIPELVMGLDNALASADEEGGT